MYNMYDLFHWYDLSNLYTARKYMVYVKNISCEWDILYSDIP